MSEQQFQMLMQLLGQVGSDAYQAAIRHAVASAIGNLAFDVVFIVALWMAERGINARISQKYAALDEYERDNYVPEWVVRLIPAVVRWFVTFMLASFAVGFVVDLVAPHYAALKALAALVTGTAQ